MKFKVRASGSATVEREVKYVLTFAFTNMVFRHILILVLIHDHIHTYVHMNAHTYIQTHTYIHSHTHASIHTHVFTHRQKPETL